MELNMKSVFATLATCFAVSLIGCSHGSDNNAPASINGAWQMSAMGDTSGHTYPATNTSLGTIQLKITDTDFTMITSDDQGVKDVVNYKTKFDGTHIKN